MKGKGSSQINNLRGLDQIVLTTIYDILSNLVMPSSYRIFYQGIVVRQSCIYAKM